MVKNDMHQEIRFCWVLPGFYNLGFMFRLMVICGTSVAIAHNT